MISRLMRYDNFILVSYSNASQLIYSLIGPLTYKYGPINKVCPSLRKFSWNWLFSFFWNSKCPYGVMTELDFLKKIFFPKMGKTGQAYGSLNTYENLVIILFVNLVYNGSLY